MNAEAAKPSAVTAPQATPMPTVTQESVQKAKVEQVPHAEGKPSVIAYDAKTNRLVTQDFKKNRRP